MRELTKLSKPELEDFFNSFDHILCDVDGVISNILESVPGASDAIKSLQKIKKEIIIVSNNTTKSLETFREEFRNSGFDVEPDNIVTPIPVMVSYLQNKNLIDEKIFALGMSPLKNALKKAGFGIIENSPDPIEESARTFAALSLVNDVTVGAVIVDIDVNMTLLNLQKACRFLERPEVEFLSGAPDRRVSIGNDKYIIGPGRCLEFLESVSERKATPMAKPSPHLNDYIIKKFKIEDRSRVLFIGDSVPADMQFASLFGYKKLLVLSGVTKESDLKTWKFPEEYKPEFYVESLKNVHELVELVFGSQ